MKCDKQDMKCEQDWKCFQSYAAGNAIWQKENSQNATKHYY